MERETRDIVINGRINVRQYAALVRYFTEQGIDIFSRSDFVNLVVENLHELMLSKGVPPLRIVSSTTEAVEILRAHGLMVDLKDRRQKRLLSNLQAEATSDVGVGEKEEDLDALAARLVQQFYAEGNGDD